MTVNNKSKTAPELLEGLTAKEAKKRLQAEGYNQLPTDKNRNVFGVIFNIVKDPMLLLLIASVSVYLVIGELKDSLVLIVSVIAVVGLTFYQEQKTEKALQTLRDLSDPQALVIRDGRRIKIPSRELVRDDIIVVSEGNQITADGVVVSTANLMVDESLLTGESAAVRKSVWDGNAKITQPGGEDLPFVFSGTLVTQGWALVRVTKVGINTEIGKIGKSLRGIKEENTLLQKEISKLVRNFAIAGFFICLFAVVAFGLVRGDWLKATLAGLTLAMSMMPEEFSVVLLIFLSLGAWRMSRHKVLVRKPAIIETLGAATALCVDKTGTLTLNKMQLAGLMTQGKFIDKINGKFPASGLELLKHSYFSCPKESFDAMEKEIRSQAEGHLSAKDYRYQNLEFIKEYPLTKDFLVSTYLWRTKDSRLELSAKGSPEAIAKLCGFNKKQHNELKSQIETMSKRGLRILGVAKLPLGGQAIPANLRGLQFEFVGLIGFIDPVRSDVKQSIKECHQAGVRVIMITGDYPGTAQFIAKQIGLKNPEDVITGDELRQLSHKELRERIKLVNVFARVLPEQKLLIVNALKANGEVVAMTGDGVNDAPALKSANIGISMGERGTDVARAASDLVLLGDDFSSIVRAIRLGRKIFDNLKKAMAFIFAIHIPIAGLSLLPIVFNLPLVLFPAHIAFLELFIDPACSTVFENEKEERDIMNRKPRNLKQALFGRQAVVLSALQGLSVLAMVFIVYLLALNFGLPETVVRSLTFSAIVFGNIMLVITNLSHRRNFFSVLTDNNRPLMIILSATIFVLLLAIYLPFLQKLFYFSSVTWWQLLLVLLSAGVSIFWFEGFKYISSKKLAI